MGEGTGIGCARVNAAIDTKANTSNSKITSIVTGTMIDRRLIADSNCWSKLAGEAAIRKGLDHPKGFADLNSSATVAREWNSTLS